jgi:hypothetical protein
MALEGHDVCSLVASLLLADGGAGGVNTLLGGRIYPDEVPQSAAFPAATVGLVAAPDTNTLGGVHVMSTVDVDVRVVTSGTSYAPIDAVARRVDALLDGASGTYRDTYAYRLRQIDFRRVAERDAGGTAFRHLIGTYRSEAHPTP